jgi:hypothetical protein
MPGKDANPYDWEVFADLAHPAGAAIAVIDADGILKLANSGWRGDGRDRQVPRAMQVRPGASCSQALFSLAQRGDESAKCVLRAFDWTRSGVVRSVRCEFFEPFPDLRWFTITVRMLRDGSGMMVTSNQLPAGQRRVMASAELRLPLVAIGSAGGYRLPGLDDAPRDRILRGRVTGVNRLVSGVVGVVEDLANRLGVRIDRALDRRNPTVFGDGLQLQVVLIALIRNALDAIVKASPHPRSIHITTTQSSSTVEICVKHHCAASFCKRPGLPQVGAIVAAHHGSLTAHRLGDHGLSMQVTLPKATASTGRLRGRGATD